MCSMPLDIIIERIFFFRRSINLDNVHVNTSNVLRCCCCKKLFIDIMCLMWWSCSLMIRSFNIFFVHGNRAHQEVVFAPRNFHWVKMIDEYFVDAHLMTIYWMICNRWWLLWKSIYVNVRENVMKVRLWTNCFNFIFCVFTIIKTQFSSSRVLQCSCNIRFSFLFRCNHFLHFVQRYIKKKLVIFLFLIFGTHKVFEILYFFFIF